MAESKRIIIISVAIFAAIGLFLISRSKTENEYLEISVPKQPPFGMVYIAQNQGFFDEEHVVVTIKDAVSGREALSQVMGGSSDLAMAAETPIATEIVNGGNIKMLGTVYSSNSNTQLLVKKDRVLSIQDLVGKKIALAKGTSMEYDLALLLRSKGLPISSVNVVDYSPADYKAVLERKDIDAIVSWSPYKQAILRESQGRLVPMQSDVYEEHGWMVGKADVLISKSDSLIRFMRAMKKAEDYMNEHPREAVAIVTNSMNDRNFADVGNAWDGVNLGLEFSNADLRTLQFVTNWIWGSRNIQAVEPNIKKFFYPDYLAMVKPEAVTIY